MIHSVTIVDDDIDLSQLAHVTAEELDNYNLGEDLPQIAGIIDERPANMIAKEDYKASNKWKSLGGDETGTAMKQTYDKKYSCDSQFIGDSSPQRPKRDASPPRRSKPCTDSLPPRRSKQSPDASPLRRAKPSLDASPARRSKKAFDLSPLRRSKRSPEASKPRRSKRSPDASPLRRSQRSPDASPLRRSKRSPDSSPPRRSRQSPDAISSKRRKESPDGTHKKMLKTLDGKDVGLQNVNALREQNELFRRREDEMFKKIRMEQSREGWY